jgi:hypothetical protein
MEVVKNNPLGDYLKTLALRGNLKMKRLQKKNCFKSGMLAGMFF